MNATQELFRLNNELSETIKRQAHARHALNKLRGDHRADSRDVSNAAQNFRALEATTNDLVQRIVNLHVMELERAERSNA